jgi:hypothetical protein
MPLGHGIPSIRTFYNFVLKFCVVHTVKTTVRHQTNGTIVISTLENPRQVIFIAINAFITELALARRWLVSRETSC